MCWEELLSMVDIWTCSCQTAVPLPLWARAAIHTAAGREAAIAGTQEWAIVPGIRKTSHCSSLSAFSVTSVLLKKSCSIFQCLEEDRPRLWVMSFSVSISKSILDQDHKCTKDNYPQQGSTGMSFVDKKVCYFHVHLFLTYELSASSAVWNNCNFPSSTY